VEPQEAEDKKETKEDTIWTEIEDLNHTKKSISTRPSMDKRVTTKEDSRNNHDQTHMSTSNQEPSWQRQKENQKRNPRDSTDSKTKNQSNQ